MLAAVTAGGKSLEGRGGGAPRSSAALGSLAGRWRGHSCPQRAVNQGLDWAAAREAVGGRDGGRLAG